VAYMRHKIEERGKVRYEDIGVTTYSRGHIMNDEAVCRGREEAMVTVRAAPETSASFNKAEPLLKAGQCRLGFRV